MSRVLAVLDVRTFVCRLGPLRKFHVGATTVLGFQIPLRAALDPDDEEKSLLLRLPPFRHDHTCLRARHTRRGRGMRGRPNFNGDVRMLQGLRCYIVS